ncbi:MULTISPECIES: Crp/Fnr family transcriptional regulator [Dehalobacter]|uniref:Cyclic nucleotide-binding domain-containing protein n=2 Tax=Dehalobacter restrictus TaxID=55583 RepID=A0A857DF86_9FIRM|nr:MULTISPECIES: Crp/Fnr family transcriptional regulator [Dehalobacter]AHF09374.1 Crp/Fnr family transcription regulator [Dehalobacter restrictus DSM 9455]MCG1025895.1 Crp/Fnr family transcriptional regulator [Dehalobacter sp.]OCZ52080.1 Crp/Fnr family transcriptional regulator [Dehalobacter sp. TeCB1]QGZ99943.1 cyclic nucleotide-binding domain-containing protein [Dehalobacter restrictus]
MERVISNHYSILPGNFYPILKLCNYTHLGVIRNYRKGDTIVLPGEIINKVVFVLSGKLGISFMNDDGRQKFMFYADPFTFADRLFAIEECFVHVVSEERSTVCFFDKEQLLSIFQQDKEVLIEFITCYASKCTYFMRESKEMAIYKPSVRVLRLLYELCRQKGKEVDQVDHVYEIDERVSQKAISEITGVHFVTICKLFRYLKKENILKKNSGKIIIYDLPRLHDLIEEWMKT